MKKIWLDSYPKDVPAEINPAAYESIIEIFKESCQKFSDRPAYYSLGSTWTYREVDLYSRQFAAYLQKELKLKKGDRMAIMLPNIFQFPIALFGALLAGMTVVNVNPLYTVRELVHQVQDSGAETILVMANFANTVQKALPETPLKNIIVTELGDVFSFPTSFVMNFVLKYIQRKVPSWNIPKAVSFKKVLSIGSRLTFDPVVVSHEDIAFLQYTGGTTGVAKAAMLTHRNMVANILQAEAWVGHLFEFGEDTMITALPLYHIFALLANGLLVMRKGGFNVLIINPRNLSQMIATMKRFKFTLFTGVNTLFNALLNDKRFSRLDFSGLKMSLGGGAAVQHAVADKWKAVTGCTLLEAYGLTEASPAVAINPTDLKEYNGSIGLPISSTDIQILDDDGHELTINQPGELAVKGPQVMLGYWNNPEETEKVFTKEGWLLTGDIASINEKGFLRILERKKDMILVSGFNVYPSEIEDVLMEIPGVTEAAVIGVPDEKSGEVPKAFIVKNNSGLTEEDVLNYCHTELTGYKVPKYVEFKSSLPKTTVGKILRRALKG